MQNTLHSPSELAIKHSQRLITYIKSLIELSGSLSFAEYMQEVLYAAGLGYYQAGSYKLGMQGDFITAPEISMLFGQCVATQFSKVLPKLQAPVIFELGAGTGKLAADILQHLASIDMLPEAYWILEVSAELKARQQEMLQKHCPDFFDRIVWCEQLPDNPFEGIIFGNEVIDALPVERFIKRGNVVKQLGVQWQNDSFAWAERDAPQALQNAVDDIEKDWPDGSDDYTSEINLKLHDWISAVTQPLSKGLVLWMDYGLSEKDYYRSERQNGTLRCYYQHHWHEDPFVYPGLQDITADVNFTQLANAGIDAGLELSGYTTQAAFLIANGLERFVGDSTLDALALQSQIRLLTHPQEMGERFKVMAFTRNLDLELGWVDLSHQL